MLASHQRCGVIIKMLMIAGLGGCDSSPTRPSDAPRTGVATSESATRPAELLAITSVTPSSGSTAGGTWGVIVGTGFGNGAVVRFGDERVRQTLVESSSSIRFWTAAHAAESVDAVVQSGDQSARLPNAYSYAHPGSFDFNGDWIAHAGSDFEADMRFTVRNNLLVSVSCAGLAVPFAPGTSIVSGAFSSVGSGGIVVTGRLVSPTAATGTIGIPPCAATWWADKSETDPLRHTSQGQ